jgi:hypothetical protein
MSIRKEIDIVLTEDSDLIVLGALCILFGTMKSRGVNNNRYDVCIYRRETLFRKHVRVIPKRVALRDENGKSVIDKATKKVIYIDGEPSTQTFKREGLVQDHIILFAALCKCDYGKMITGVGPVKATQIVEKLAPAFPQGFSSDIDTWADTFRQELCKAYKEVTRKTLSGMFGTFVYFLA